ncbi:MAG: Sir2 silent information regulator family NAD-dependent deacetylase [Clostridium sp.]|nr:Sir2 silent information regulator family NAD-dependent deacetylase [Clostridium sp.]MCM1208453.1 Sir2 silent information regulator family NAD-dependent deacetylase [Ruminococcus sp.]
MLRDRKKSVEAEHTNQIDKIQALREKLMQAETVIIGAGAGLSTTAGFTYSGKRFQNYFGDFASKYHFRDMYSGGFYPYQTLNEHWAYWSRYIYINRYTNPPKPLYKELYKLVQDKDYFVITTNVDHCFQKAGFDKKRLYYTQGDYGLFQCSEPCHEETYDNYDTILKMVQTQGWQIDTDNNLYLPEGISAKMTVPDELIPHCPKCGKPMNMNLRADDTFVQDEGWHKALERYEIFLKRHKHTATLFLELGVGYNTPAIIKYPFWNMTYNWKNADYACLNMGEAFAPEEIKFKSICMNDDINFVIHSMIDA